MKLWIALPLALFSATQAVAEERHLLCTSDRDGSEIRLSRAADGDKGSIETPIAAGDAVILKGVGSMTFMYIEGQNVMTLVVQLDDMSYDLSVKGPHADEDFGKCQDVQA